MGHPYSNTPKPQSGPDTVYDILIIGGGINGTAIARDAAGRGLSVCLCEKDDLANHTSSASTKLIHGGLRYLEQYEFRLVRESLKEREVLLRAAPHIIWPMRFVLPYDKGLRPKWMLRAGLFLYDSLGGREILPGTKTVKLTQPPHSDALEPRLTMGFEYSDCWVEDSRLVVLNAVDAAQNGAHILTRTQISDIQEDGGDFTAIWKSTEGATGKIIAKTVVNAAGPWVENVLHKFKHGRNKSSLRLVKGSHIITKRLFEGDHAYIFQNADDRVIFAIPYEGNYTLIGTTDVPFQSGVDKAEASPKEISYLCDAANEYFRKDISPADVVRTYSGVRPLYDDQSTDASEVTRDYVLNVDHSKAGAPFLSVYGGKITTSRKLAEHVMGKLLDHFPQAGAAWTKTAHFPGGDISNADFNTFYQNALNRYSIAQHILYRLCRAYGTKIETLLAMETSDGSPTGILFGAGLCESEALYLSQYEWAQTPEDILWRRSKLGLHMTAQEQEEFETWHKSAFTNLTTQKYKPKSAPQSSETGV